MIRQINGFTGLYAIGTDGKIWSYVDGKYCEPIAGQVILKRNDEEVPLLVEELYNDHFGKPKQEENKVVMILKGLM